MSKEKETINAYYNRAQTFVDNPENEEILGKFSRAITAAEFLVKLMCEDGLPIEMAAAVFSGIAGDLYRVAVPDDAIREKMIKRVVKTMFAIPGNTEVPPLESWAPAPPNLKNFDS